MEIKDKNSYHDFDNPGAKARRNSHRNTGNYGSDFSDESSDGEGPIAGGNENFKYNLGGLGSSDESGDDSINATKGNRNQR